jgi:hypothetical protein
MGVPSSLCTPCENALALRLMAAKRRWKAMRIMRIMRIMRSKLLSVAENQPRYGRGNAPGKLVFPWGEAWKEWKSLLPATSGFVPAMMPCE